jgi:signal transduction histidine kinase
MDPNEIKAMNEENNMVGGEYKTITLEIRYSSEIVGYIVIGQYEAVLVSEQDKNFINTINQNIAISVLIAIIVSVFISFYFSKQFSNPIKSVSDTSVQLTAGNYSAVVTAKSSVTEISNLIKSINILGNRLAYQDDLRKRLVSDISHEIRTPLNIFQNNLEAMIDGVFPASIERLNNLNDEVIRFGKLLNNLDLLKEFEEEKTVLHFETVSIVEILTTIYNDFMLIARRKEIDMELLIKPGCQYLMQGNRDNLKQVFLNILSNAVKFTERGGKIMIEMSFDKVHLYVNFKDNGIGIRKEDLPFIFERLYRGDKSRNEIEGAGIGLTVVKKIMLLHSATIEVESEEGTGSSFLLRFNR